MLGDFIAGSPGEMNYSERFQIVLVNNFCTYCSNFLLWLKLEEECEVKLLLVPKTAGFVVNP